MRQVLLAIFLSLAICLPSCKRSSSVLPTGGGSVRIGNNGWGMWYAWKGNEILYVLFLREAEPTPAGPAREGESASVSGILTRHSDVLLDGKDFTVDFTSAAADVINIAGVEYTLSKGRVFLCSVENGGLIVKQVDVPVQRNSDWQQETRRLATEPTVQEFLSATATQPADTNK